MSTGGWFGRWWPSLLALVGTVAVIGVLLLVAGREVEPIDAGDVFGDDPAELETPPATAEPTGTAAAPEPTAEPVRAPVVVLNQTRVEGLAAETADALRAQGWEVVEVGSFPSGVPSTTVYYPPDLEDAARAMDEEWTGVDRVMPVFAGLREDVLTLILAETEEPPVPAGG